MGYCQHRNLNEVALNPELRYKFDAARAAEITWNFSASDVE